MFTASKTEHAHAQHSNGSTAHLRMKRGSSVRTRADMTADPPASNTPRGISLKGPMTSLYTCSSDSPCRDPGISALQHECLSGHTPTKVWGMLAAMQLNASCKHPAGCAIWLIALTSNQWQHSSISWHLCAAHQCCSVCGGTEITLTRPRVSSACSDPPPRPNGRDGKKPPCRGGLGEALLEEWARAEVHVRRVTNSMQKRRSKPSRSTRSEPKMRQFRACVAALSGSVLLPLGASCMSLEGAISTQEMSTDAGRQLTWMMISSGRVKTSVSTSGSTQTLKICNQRSKK